MTNPENRAIVLLSGGADSATCLAVAARQEKLSCLALSFSYGQQHSTELAAATNLATALACEHLVMELDPKLFSASSLTGATPIPEDRNETEIGVGIPTTYVPARNLVFLSLAAALAESRQANHIYIGVNALDYSGYPDCRPDFIDSFRSTLAKGTKLGVEGNPVKIETPLIGLTKAEIFKLGIDLGVDFRLTVSCYQADRKGHACGKCDSCKLRQKGFLDAGLTDQTNYQA